MSDRQRRRIIAIVLLLVVLLLAKSVWGVWQKNATARAARQEAETELTALKERHQALEMRVTRLETPQGEEEEMRRNFPVVKAGEKLIVIVDEEASTGEATSSESWLDKFLKPFNN